MTGLCAPAFNFFRVYEIRVVNLALERRDASTCNGRKDNGGEAAKENEFVSFALITVLPVVTQPIRRVVRERWTKEAQCL